MPGTLAGHLRAAAVAAVEAGDLEGARVALDAIERIARREAPTPAPATPAAPVVDLSAERARRRP